MSWIQPTYLGGGCAVMSGDASWGHIWLLGQLHAAAPSGRRAGPEDGSEVRDSQGWCPEPLLEKCLPHANPHPHPCPGCSVPLSVVPSLAVAVVVKG